LPSRSTERNDDAEPPADEELPALPDEEPELEGEDEEPELPDGEDEEELPDGEVALEPLLPVLPIEPLEEPLDEPLAPAPVDPLLDVPAARATLDTAETAKAKTTALLINFIVKASLHTYVNEENNLEHCACSRMGYIAMRVPST
jgi:hypothetical protein